MRKQEKIRREKLKAVKPPPAETTKKEDAQAIAARRKLPPAAKTKKESYEVVEARRKLLHGKKAYRLKEQIVRNLHPVDERETLADNGI